MRGNKGFSLIELVISMTIFLVLMGIVTKAFDTIVSHAGKTGRAAESDISGLVGLEILRRDVEHAGFGLLWSYQAVVPTFKEVDVADGFPIQGINGTNYNDAPPTTTTDLESAAPHALLSATTTTSNRMIDGSGSYLTNAGSDYLVIKSVPVGMNDATKHWSYVNYSSTGGYLKRWNNQDDLKANDHVISLITSFSSETADSRTLAVADVSTVKKFAYKVAATSNEVPPYPEYRPIDELQKITTYALANNSGNDYIRMPYNRADYFIRKTAESKDMPASCSPGTGIFYKFIVNQGNSLGYGQQLPLLDCVGDFQVMYELDTSGVANSGTMSYTDTINGMTARQIREQLRTVRLYLLTHEGKQDRNYQFPYTNASQVLLVGDPLYTSFGREWTATMMNDFFGSTWRGYRWKVVSIVVQPKNLYNQ